MPDQKKTIPEMRQQIAQIQQQIDHPLTTEERKVVHRATIAKIEEVIRRVEAAPIVAQSREAVQRIQNPECQEPRSFAPQSNEAPTAPTGRLQLEQPAAPESLLPLTNLERREMFDLDRAEELGRPIDDERRDSLGRRYLNENGFTPEMMKEMANRFKSRPWPATQARTILAPKTMTGRANINDLPGSQRALPGWFRLKFGEVLDLDYTKKGLYHLLPEFITFARAVEYYAALCAYWRIEVMPGDVELNWSKLSADKQEVRRAVWDLIVEHAKTKTI